VNLINFTSLNIEQKKMVLYWRNNDIIRQEMINRDIISMSSHMSYIDNLVSSKTKKSFLIEEDKINIGVISFQDIDYNLKQANIGLYKNPYLNKPSGDLLLNSCIQYGFNSLLLKKLNLEVFRKNETAIKLYRRFNFKEKIHKKKDMIYMSLVNNEV